MFLYFDSLNSYWNVVVVYVNIFLYLHFKDLSIRVIIFCLPLAHLLLLFRIASVINMLWLFSIVNLDGWDLDVRTVCVVEKRGNGR